MRTTNALTLFLLAFLAYAPTANAHGVERGSILESLLGDDVNESLSRQVEDTLSDRCNLRGATALSATKKTQEQKVDQNVTDRLHLFRIIVEKDGMEEVILLRLAEYAFSNPGIPNQEILSLESSLCR